MAPQEEEEKTTAIITGSARGIGKEQHLLAKRGLNVVVCSRTKSEVIQQLMKSKSKALRSMFWV